MRPFTRGQLAGLRLIRQAEADAARAVAEREAATRETAEVWPVRDVLAKLADATDHLLRDHDCDTHGHEEFAAARDAARSMLAAPVLPVEGDSVYLAWLTPLLRDLRDAVSTQDVRRAKHAIELAVHHHLSPAATAAPQEPRGEPGEAERMRPVSLRSDMGPQVLTAIIEDDGDVDLRLFDEQCGGISWQACVPGTGGGRYPHTLRALRALVHAMHLDAAKHEARDAD